MSTDIPKYLDCCDGIGYHKHNCPINHDSSEAKAWLQQASRFEAMYTKEVMLHAVTKLEIRELRDSLRKLANEASGFLAMADRQTHGHTNMAVLRMRIDDARALLETSGGEGQKA